MEGYGRNQSFNHSTTINNKPTTHSPAQNNNTTPFVQQLVLFTHFVSTNSFPFTKHGERQGARFLPAVKCCGAHGGLPMLNHTQKQHVAWAAGSALGCVGSSFDSCANDQPLFNMVQTHTQSTQTLCCPRAAKDGFVSCQRSSWLNCETLSMLTVPNPW